MTSAYFTSTQADRETDTNGQMDRQTATISSAAGFAKFANLNFHRKFLHFTTKRREFDYFDPLTAKYQNAVPDEAGCY